MGRSFRPATGYDVSSGVNAYAEEDAMLLSTPVFATRTVVPVDSIVTAKKKAKRLREKVEQAQGEGEADEEEDAEEEVAMLVTGEDEMKKEVDDESGGIIEGGAAARGVRFREEHSVVLHN